MLQVSKSPSVTEDYEPAASPASSPVESLELVFGTLRRHLILILASSILTTLLALAYLAVTPASFTAVATLLIDRGKVQPFGQQQQVYVDSPIDSAQIESQIQILTSDKIALSVIDQLNLTQKLDSSSTRNPLTSEQMLMVFQKSLKVSRVGMSFVIEVRYVSTSAKLSAAVANAVVEAYINNEIETRNGTAEKATIWLQDRIRELAEQSTAADRAVAEFKAKNNIVQANNGQIVNDQQVSELNTRLVDARAQSSAAEARLDRINHVLRADGAGSVTDTLNSPIDRKSVV